MINTHWLQ